MQEAWYQLWAEIPMVGRQWAGWIWTNQIRAAALSLALKGCAGAKYTVLDQNGLPVDTQLGLPPGIDIGQILGGLGGLGWGG